jgi:hypothetical protein
MLAAGAIALLVVVLFALAGHGYLRSIGCVSSVSWKRLLVGIVAVLVVLLAVLAAVGFVAGLLPAREVR